MYAHFFKGTVAVFDKLAIKESFLYEKGFKARWSVLFKSTALIHLLSWKASEQEATKSIICGVDLSQIEIPEIER